MASFDFQFGRNLETFTLTDEHSASSYDIPVLVWRGKAYGPNDVLWTATQGVANAFGPPSTVEIIARVAAQYVRIEQGTGELMPEDDPRSILFAKFNSVPR